MFGTLHNAEQGGASPLGRPVLRRKGYNMITAINNLWSLMTIFFSTTVLGNDLFLAMIILSTIFASIYIFMWFLDRDTWGW